MTTFEEFKASRKYVSNLAPYTSGFAEFAGYLYLDAFYIGVPNEGSTSAHYEVSLAGDDRTFGTIEEAERFLWEEFADSELNDEN